METTRFSQIPEKSRACLLFTEELSNNDLISSINNLKLKDNYNIAKLIRNYKLTQSQYIKIGNELEKIIKRVIQKLGFNDIVFLFSINISIFWQNKNYSKRFYYICLCIIYIHIYGKRN